MPGLIVITIWILCAIVLFFILSSFVKAMCRGSPAARSVANSTASATAVPAASIAGTASVNDGAAATSRDVLSTLPFFVYSSAAQKKQLNCSVCLADLKEGEKGRFLPRCFHCFHVECVDVWLASHLECPVCRASIDPEASQLPV